MAARRPNVLIVLMDQLQRGALGSYGCRAARTPEFDRLAADGLRLTRAYVPLPQCAPARASMFTGRYPHQHRVYRIGDSTEFPADWQVEVGPLVHRTPLPESVPSLGQAFNDAGYRMGYTGPWHMGDDETPHHGWTDFWRTLPLLERRSRLLHPAPGTARASRDLSPRAPPLWRLRRAG